MQITTVLNSILAENAGFDKIKYLANGIVWQIRKKLQHNFIKKIHTGGFVKVQPCSAYTPMFYFKWPEFAEQQFIRKCKNLATTFVDVGANVGLFSLHVIDCFENFYLFEPSPSTFKALEETCNLNENVKWHLCNIGVADKKGEMLFMDEDNLSSTSRFCDANMPDAKKSKKIIVNVDLLDNLISESVGDIILKVDVEGFEERVFKGANRIFLNNQAKLVMFERLRTP